MPISDAATALRRLVRACSRARVHVVPLGGRHPAEWPHIRVRAPDHACFAQCRGLCGAGAPTVLRVSARQLRAMWICGAVGAGKSLATWGSVRGPRGSRTAGGVRRHRSTRHALSPRRRGPSALPDRRRRTRSPTFDGSWSRRVAHRSSCARCPTVSPTSTSSCSRGREPSARRPSRSAWLCVAGVRTAELASSISSNSGSGPQVAGRRPTRACRSLSSRRCTVSWLRAAPNSCSSAATYRGASGCPAEDLADSFSHRGSPASRRSDAQGARAHQGPGRRRPIGWRRPGRGQPPPRRPPRCHRDPARPEP